MNYDKESFLTGVAVGRQLRGWSVAETGGAGISFPTIAVRAGQPVALSATLGRGPDWDTVSVVEMEET